ncbi:MAG: glycosyltransferase [Blastochloris viridis]|uniref:Glycosyltransferase n=1 Tax=Blastochloris viridis TaxID=1079 RepID=A0A6N4R1U9_BLAVI|nr:MAG: glycosyltransferase [Blastochloris viridis]
MKIIFVLDQLQHGGIATTYTRWASRLLEEGYQVAFFCQKHSGPLASEIPSGAELHINNSRYAFTASGALFQYLRRQPEDSILIAGGFTLIYAQALRPSWMKLWAYMPSSPGIGSRLNTQQSPLAEYLRYTLMRHAVRKSDAVSGVSHGTAQDVEHWANLPLNSVATVYNPAYTEAFATAAKSPAPHPWLKDASLTTFCSFGRLVATKNHLNLLKAFHKVHAQNPSTRLLIGGSGHLRPQLEAFIAENFPNPAPVQLLGNVANPADYMAHAHAYVSSSQLEAFGNVLIEALATGTQVIATNAPYGPAEILTSPEIGTLVPVNDADALASAMLRSLTTNPQTHKKARLARAKQFTAQALWPQFKAVLNHLSPSKNHPAEPRVTIIQRVVAAYRKPVFESLANTYGWNVAAATNFPNPQSFNAVLKAPWLTTFRYLFLGNPYRCHVPLFTIIRRQKPDAIILEAGTQMTSTWLSILLWPWLKALGIRVPKLILWGHGAPVAFGTSPWRRKVFTTLRRLMLTRADGYLTYTKPEATYLQTMAPHATIGYVTNTIDIAPILKLRTTEWKKSKALHILMVGRITPDKRFLEAIAAMPQIWEHIPTAQLTIIGGGPELETLRTLAGSELNKRIHLPGPIHDEAALATYYNRSQLFWLMGAAGLGVNHALAYGVPVLAYAPDLPNGPRHHPEIYYVEDGINGWLVPNASLQAMVSQLILLLQATKPPRQQLGKTLEDYAAQHLSLTNATEAMHAFVHKVVSQPSRR